MTQNDHLRIDVQLRYALRNVYDDEQQRHFDALIRDNDERHERIKRACEIDATFRDVVSSLNNEYEISYCAICAYEMRSHKCTTNAQRQQRERRIQRERIRLNAIRNNTIDAHVVRIMKQHNTNNT